MKYEYKMYVEQEGDIFQDELNKLGEEGWELVCFTPVDEEHDFPGYLFKREKK